ncbi:MSH2 protein, partial [Bonamia ostreae]
MKKGAIEAMNLFSFGHKNSKFVLKQKSPKSIFELLNKTKTANGAKLLKRFLLQPLFDKSKIEKRLQIVQFLLENGKERIKIQNVLKKVPNIDNLRKKLIIGTCNVQDLVALYDFSKTTIPEMASVLNFKENLSFVEKSAISSLKMDVQSPLQ